MTDNLSATLYFRARAQRARGETERARLLAAAEKFRKLAIAESGRFIAELPKRPAAASVRRAVKRKRA